MKCFLASFEKRLVNRSATKFFLFFGKILKVSTQASVFEDMDGSKLFTGKQTSQAFGRNFASVFHPVLSSDCHPRGVNADFDLRDAFSTIRICPGDVHAILS